MLISGNKTPKAGFVEDSILVAQGQKCHLDSSVIEISSDDDDDNNDNDDESIDNHGDVHHSSSFNYPGIDVVHPLLFIKFINHSVIIYKNKKSD